MADIKEKISEKLGNNGSLGSGDVSSFAKPKEGGTGAKSPEKPVGDVSTPISPLSFDDPIAQIALNKEKAASKANMVNAGKDAGIKIDYENVVVTEDDRNEFIESLIDNTRYTRPFSIFGGRVSGVIRSRTADESRALMNEAQRRAHTGEVLSDADYSDIFRKAVLRLQVAELNSVQYPPAAAPLMAQFDFQATEDDKEVIPPAWYDEAVKVWGSKQEGLVTAIYGEVMKFEFKYWTLVENSADQDFWNPED